MMFVCVCVELRYARLRTLIRSLSPSLSLSLSLSLSANLRPLLAKDYEEGVEEVEDLGHVEQPQLCVYGLG